MYMAILKYFWHKKFAIFKQGTLQSFTSYKLILIKINEDCDFLIGQLNRCKMYLANKDRYNIKKTREDSLKEKQEEWQNEKVSGVDILSIAVSIVIVSENSGSAFQADVDDNSFPNVKKIFI